MIFQQFLIEISNSGNADKIRFSPEAEEEFKRLHTSLTDLAESSIELLEKNTSASHEKAKEIQERETVYRRMDETAQAVRMAGRIQVLFAQGYRHNRHDPR